MGILGLAAIVVLGIGAQWLAWRLRLPSILLLLVAGFLAGPEASGLVDPDRLLGSLLFPLVAVSVGVLLFEGGLSLRLPELGDFGRVVLRLVTLGAFVTWVLAAVAAMLLLGLDPSLAILLGAVLTVTGPTVVLPLLRQIRPTGVVGPILKWEGILIDPVGAVLAVLVYEGIVEGTLQGVAGVALFGILKTLLLGGGIGVAAAVALVALLRRFWIPDHLHSPAALALAIAAFAAANAVQHESGLLAVTLMGVVLANQDRVSIRHILEFKENVRVLIISALFIILAARVRLADLRGLDAGAILFVVVLIAIVRPLAVLVSTRGARLQRKERIFLAAMAPRGIVAATVASVFALRLETVEPAARTLVPVTFLVIVGTVIVYGLAAAPLARRLGLAVPRPQGILVIGAHPWARALAATLKDQGLGVLLVDTNAANVAAARMAGLAVYHGSPLVEEADEELDLPGIGRLFALTGNDEVNALTAIHFAHLFGRREVYQLPSDSDVSQAVSAHLRGRYLFDPAATHDRIEDLFESGAQFKATPLTDQFGYDAWLARYGDDAVPLLMIDADGIVTVRTAVDPAPPLPGHTLVALVPETETQRNPPT